MELNKESKEKSNKESKEESKKKSNKESKEGSKKKSGKEYGAVPKSNKNLMEPITHIEKTVFYKLMRNHPDTQYRLIIMMKQMDKIGVLYQFPYQLAYKLSAPRLDILFVLLCNIELFAINYARLITSNYFQSSFRSIFDKFSSKFDQQIFSKVPDRVIGALLDSINCDIGESICVIIAHYHNEEKSPLKLAHILMGKLSALFSSPYYNEIFPKLGFNVRKDMFVEYLDDLKKFIEEFIKFADIYANSKYNSFKKVAKYIFSKDLTDLELYDYITINLNMSYLKNPSEGIAICDKLFKEDDDYLYERIRDMKFIYDYKNYYFDAKYQKQYSTILKYLVKPPTQEQIRIKIRKDIITSFIATKYEIINNYVTNDVYSLFSNLELKEKPNLPIKELLQDVSDKHNISIVYYHLDKLSVTGMKPNLEFIKEKNIYEMSICCYKSLYFSIYVRQKSSKPQVVVVI